ERHLPFRCELLADSVDKFQFGFCSSPKVNIFNSATNLYEAPTCDWFLGRSGARFDQRDKPAKLGISAELKRIHWIDMSVTLTVRLYAMREILNVNVV